MIENLLRIHCKDWITSQTVITDWHDGPVAGFCRLNKPNLEFYFSVIAEIFCENDVDIRLYEIFSIDDGSIRSIVNKLSFLGKPKDVVWVPIWLRDSNKSPDDVDGFINQIIDKAIPECIVFASQDLKDFSAVWNVKNSKETINDWNSYIKLVDPISFNSMSWPPQDRL